MMDGMGIQPVYNMGNDGSRDNNGWGDSCWWIWIIVLFAFFGWGGYGFGNGFGGNGAGLAYGVPNGINNDFLYTNLNSTMDRGFTQLANQNFGIQQDICQGFSSTNLAMCQGFNGVNNSLCQGFNGVQMGIANLGYNMADCCCETNRNIDAVRYENAKNTCDIIQAGNANTQRIIDVLTQNEINALRTELQSAQLALANSQQTTNIINAVRPFPSPAYITCSPYTSPIGNGCGAYNGCCGC